MVLPGTYPISNLKVIHGPKFLHGDSYYILLADTLKKRLLVENKIRKCKNKLDMVPVFKKLI